ncbi:MAG: hypothetical protein ACJ8J7_16405 [Sulfurifustaceae bacterium]
MTPTIALLSACAGIPGTADLASAPADGCDYRGPSGICVKVEEGATRVSLTALETEYLRAKRDVEERYGFDLSQVPGPTVHVMGVPAFARVHPIKNRVDGDTGGDHGWTDFATGHITLTGGAVMRHESFHYLLWAAGVSNALNAVHEHPAFDEYRDGQWLPRRAQASAGKAQETATSAR